MRLRIDAWRAFNPVGGWRPGLVRFISAVIVLIPLGHGQQSLPYDLVNIYLPPDGSVPGSFGADLAVADFNHDGFGDVLAPAPYANLGPVLDSGKAFILYGPRFEDYLIIAAQNPSAAENMGLLSRSIGDVNGDGEFDVLLGSPGWDAGGGFTDEIGRAHLFLGPEFTTDIVFNDPSPELQGAFGYDVVLVDLDGDGLDDVAVGAVGKTVIAGSTALPNVGQVWVWNATNFAGLPTLVWLPKPSADAYFGSRLAKAPSQTGPGDDLLVSALGVIAQPCLNCEGKIYRYHTPGTGVLSVINPPNQPPFPFQFGFFMFTGDIDGDGETDLFVGAPDALEQVYVYPGPLFAQPVVTLANPGGPGGTGFAARGVAADLDRDGHVDLLVGDPQADSWQNGVVHVYWGPDFTPMDDLLGTAGLGFGSGVATGDIDGDGYDEILVHSPVGGGAVWYFRRRTLQADATVLEIDGGPSVNFTLDLGTAQAGNAFLAVLSTTEPGDGLILGPGTYLPLFPDAMTSIGLTLLGTPILSGFEGLLDAQGHAAFTLNWPAGKGGSFVGKTLHVCAITGTAAGALGVGTNDVALPIVH